MRLYYRAKKRAAIPAIIYFLLAGLAVACAVLAYRFNIPALYVASFSAAALQLQIFILYVGSAYEYELDDGVLRIYRITGKSRLRIFDLDLRFADAMLGYSEYREYKKTRGKPRRTFVCLCGVPKKRARIILYGTSALLFAPDEAFAAAVKSRIGSEPVCEQRPV